MHAIYNRDAASRELYPAEQPVILILRISQSLFKCLLCLTTAMNLAVDVHL